MTYLGQKGFTIFKESLDVEEQLLIRKELEVAPWVPKSSFHKPPSFPIYRESKKKFYIPRFYGIENYGAPEENRISCGEDIESELVFSDSSLCGGVVACVFYKPTIRCAFISRSG